MTVFLGSVAWTGFSPFAPATASTAFLALIFWLWGPGPLGLLLLLIPALAISVPVSSAMSRYYGGDPGRCTIDELAGFLLALQGRDLGAPGAWLVILAAFFLFRFFDILKVWPGRRLERLPRGWGIVADDLLAGLYTAVVLLALFR